MLKGILEKSLSTILVAAIMGIATLMYKEFETYQEIRNLIDVRKELETSFIKEVEDRKNIDNGILIRLNKIEKQHKKDSTNLKYTKEWVDYWVSQSNYH